MSEQLRLERHLPGLLEDLYLAGTPTYRNDVLAAVARTRQRPAWTFPERWLPMTDIATRRAYAPGVPFRALVVLALLVALAVAALAFIGSQTRELPKPFGPARNGVIVYSVDGDLFTVGTDGGQPRSLVSSPQVERQPAVSPDGTKVAFLRGAAEGAEDAFALVVIGIDGGATTVLEASSVGDADGIVWAPDSSYLLRHTGGEDIIRYDLAGGAPLVLGKAAYLPKDAFQPPSGDRILFEAAASGRSLWVMNTDGTDAAKVYEIPTAELSDGCDFGAVAWSPDGTRIAFMRQPAGETEQCRIFVMSVDGSGAHPLTTAEGHWFETDFRWSPDGSQIAFDRWHKNEATGQWEINPIGVVSATGGPVRSIGPTPISDGAAFEWSPDGTTIVSVGGNVVGWAPLDLVKTAKPVLIDVATGEHREGSWSMSSWPAWQRLAP